jgi:hypothetical protein
MDLQLYLRVFWRFRVLVLIGFVLAIQLTFLAVVRVGFEDGKPQLTFREQQKWAAYSTLFVTQRGFPWGRSVINTDQVPQSQPKEADKVRAQQFADPGRFSSLALLYSQLATSDPVRQIMLKHGPIDGEITAVPVLSQDAYAAALPLISMAGVCDKPACAITLGRRHMNAFRTFLEQQQKANDIEPRYRVALTVVKQPRKAELLAGRSITVPALAFISVMIVTLGLCLILENMRPRTRPVVVEAKPEAEPTQTAAGGLR